MVLELCGEWYSPRPPHFVGAMKIARNAAVSGRYVEWYSPIVPGSLSEG